MRGIWLAWTVWAAVVSVLRVPAGVVTAAENSAPPYQIQPRGGALWIVAPDGRPFFSLGVCCVGMGIPRGEYDPQKPGYAAWRQYADPASWADATLQRLQSWGFTTIGGWSDDASLRGSKRM